MSDTSRDAVERVMVGLRPMIEALLAAKEAAEAEYRDFERSVAEREEDFARKIGKQEARAEAAEAEAAALRGKLEAAREGLETAQAQAQGTPHQPFCEMVILTCAYTLATLDQPKEGDRDDG